MPGFLIAVGENHQAITAKIMAGNHSSPHLGIGEPSITQQTELLTTVEWGHEASKLNSDFVSVTCFNNEIEGFLYGYLTSPEKICRANFSSASPAFLSLLCQIATESPAATPNLLCNLNGSFVLLTIRKRDNTVYVCSDRFASRTVWRLHHEGTWLLASHPAILWLSVGRRNDVNSTSLGSLLLRARPVGDQSLLSAGRRNLPGYLYSLTVSGQERSVRWFKPHYNPESNVNVATWGGRLAEVLKSSAGRLKGVTNNPILFLSGGLDSRVALAGLAPEVLPHCVTLFDGENYETKIARAVANAVGAPHYTVQRDRLWYLRVMERAALLQGGVYHPSHSHFSEGLKKIGFDINYDSVLLGDFLEAFQKLLGNHIEVLGKKPDATMLCNNVLTLDGQYAAFEKLNVLDYLNKSVRKRVYQSWFSELMEAASEALEVSHELPASVDYFLRWRAAYEVSTYGMIEDIRSVAQERSLSMDNEMHDLMLAIPSNQRKYGRIALEAIKILNPQLVSIPNANTMIPAYAPYWCHKAVKFIRPRIGAARQAYNRRFRAANSVISSSWTDCRILATTDRQWIEFIDRIFLDPEAFPDNIFDIKKIQEAWRRYQSGELRLGFSIDSLLTFGIVHKYFGSGILN